MGQALLHGARVRVPCSTSNLGAGFDCLGLALSRYVAAEFQPGESQLSVQRTGTVAGLTAERDLVHAAFIAELHRLAVTEIRGVLRIASEIPVGRGLGSSAAATVAGLLLAHAVVNSGEPDRHDALQTTAAREGHPDNAAPALFGGLVAVARASAATVRAFRLPLSAAIGFAFAAPDVEVPTPLARRALPASVPHELAARGLGRVAALLQGLALGDPELLRIGFGDELHVPFRLPLIPHGQQAIEAGLDAGAWAVTISGSGSGLIAACARGTEAVIADAMARALHQSDTTVTAFVAEPDVRGATIETESWS